MKFTGSIWLAISIFTVRLRGEMQVMDNDAVLGLNDTTIRDLLKLQTNPFLQDLQGHWTFNDTNDISKYEDFDLTKFQEQELPLEELLQKMKELRQSGNLQASRTTQPPEEMPTFDSSLVTNVSAQLGSVAFLRCRVRNLNNRAVSWIRMRDWHILTSATFTYTNDERFQVIHSTGTDDWTLQIKFVQKRDSGAYECQVATGRGTLSHRFNLIVIVPSAYILGSGEIHIGQGSDVTLVCIIENSPTPPQFVMWYHNDIMINSEDTDGDSQTIRVVTDPGREKTHSRLLISRARSSHSGNYSCRATNAEPDSVHVFVFTEGDNTAAIQRQDAAAIEPSKILFLLVLMYFFL